MPMKACPVVIEPRGGQRCILLLRHPLAGVQLVKGTVEEGEGPQAAALRELAEEAGIERACVEADLGAAEVATGQVWRFFHVSAEGLGDHWVHRCTDDGGHDFSLFWHPLSEDPEDCHPMFRAALAFIRRQLG